MIEQTLILVKPDGVYRGLIGEVISRFEKRGLKIVGMKMMWIDKDFAKKHYAGNLSKAFYPKLEEFITSGPVIAMCVEGVNAVEVVRKIVGPTEPRLAPPGTIRGDYCHISTDHADKTGKSVCNVIHASGNIKEAQEEVKLWFSVDEIHTYERAEDKWVR